MSRVLPNFLAPMQCQQCALTTCVEKTRRFVFYKTFVRHICLPCSASLVKNTAWKLELSQDPLRCPIDVFLWMEFEDRICVRVVSLLLIERSIGTMLEQCPQGKAITVYVIRLPYAPVFHPDEDEKKKEKYGVRVSKLFESFHHCCKNDQVCRHEGPHHQRDGYCPNGRTCRPCKQLREQQRATEQRYREVRQAADKLIQFLDGVRCAENRCVMFRKSNDTNDSLDKLRQIVAREADLPYKVSNVSEARILFAKMEQSAIRDLVGSDCAQRA
jgi:hypothetical protein